MAGFLKRSVLVLHGSGVTLRGIGKKDIERFGPLTYPQYEEKIQGWADQLNLEVTFVQSNSEGALIDALFDHFTNQRSSFVIINPAGHTVGYKALSKALLAVEERMPAIEVHITNLFRNSTVSDVSPSVQKVIVGFGIDGYRMALESIAKSFES